MITNIYKFTDELLIKQNKTRSSFYSQVIKAERLRRKMTLQEVAEGICSISYLSKMENREVEPNIEYLVPLLERVEVDYKTLDNFEVSNTLYDSFAHYYYGNKDLLESNFYTLKTPTFTVAASLLKAIYYLSSEKYDLFKSEIKLIDKVKNTLEKEEAIALFTLVIEYYNLTYQFRRSNDLLLCNERLISASSNRIIRLLHLDQFAIVAFNLDDRQRFNDTYHLIFSEFSLSTSVVKLIEKRLMLMICRLSNFKDESLEEIKLMHQGIDAIDYNFDLLYYKYYAKIKARQYLETFQEIFERGYYIDCRFLSFLGICAKQLRDPEYKKKYIDLACSYQYEAEDEIHKRFNDLIVILFINENSYDVVEYMRDNIVPYRKTYLHPLYDPIYDELYVDRLSRISKYKDATKYLLNKA